MLRYVLISLFIFGCGEQSPSFLKEPINQINDPKLIPGSVTTLEYVFNKLPTSGKVDRIWSGWWYPASEGGTSSTRYGSPSALKKYDMATGSQSNAWEIDHSRRYANVSWAGKCNGLAAAGIMQEEPTKPVVYNDVSFSVTDVKALLIDAWQGSGYIVGDRCEKTQITYDRYGRIQQEECRDANPGTFHLALTNYLGLFGKSLILDTDNSEAVWNYPVVSFEVVTTQALTNDEAAWRVQNESSYAFNPNAIDFVYVKISVSILNFNPKFYEYILELDIKGKIIGGEWLGRSRTEHPDFIWRPETPRAENPHLDVQTINKIYKQSI